MTDICLLSQLYTIIESDPYEWSLNGLGRSSSKTGRILLNQSLLEDTKMATLLHEIIHQIMDLNGIEIPSMEPTVSVIANGLFDFLRRNKEVALRIMGVENDYQNAGTENQKVP